MFRENADNIWHEPANFAMPERIQQNHCFAIAVMTHKHAENDTVVSLLIIVSKVRFVTSGKLGVCPNHSQTVVPSTFSLYVWWILGHDQGTSIFPLIVWNWLELHKRSWNSNSKTYAKKQHRTNTEDL